ncbi:Uncharacterised protein [Salmonella enterica subsp. enterica serovar Bovismorbificans]|uniref:Uncharacterized protein n=1 Tax=Salmonella enterica subsp. enterica serovar Bovismorbificans TaxID=58097 RepID=A0A655EPA2_SALET|nr:Uncharacterised protein [Salmonella enterica subsp. enterica serovar Bovismorbificans]CNV28316.1 Uncharacterised protein [Salmonella enterica subsp. enterica serovar Bovismorbificans]CPR70611.1 Uncharacterised protein [Salmonella enterica subsp. enterica serovar Bovismorbificans]
MTIRQCATCSKFPLPGRIFTDGRPVYAIERNQHRCHIIRRCNFKRGTGSIGDIIVIVDAAICC